MASDTLIRAYEIPVAAPVSFQPMGPKGRKLGPARVPTWAEFDAVCETCWRLSTDLANWAVTELAKADSVIPRSLQQHAADALDAAGVAHAGAGKLAPLAAKPFGGRALYDHFVKTYPFRKQFDSATKGAGSLLRRVEAKYRQERYDTIWLRRKAFPCFRFPHPFPLHPQSFRVVADPDWTPESGPGGKYVIDMALPGGRWKLALRSNEGEFGRQLAAVRQLLAGAAKACEFQLYDKPSHDTDHRHTHTRRAAGGGRTMRFQTVVRLVLRVPKPARRVADGVLKLMTDPAAFWTAEIDGRCDRPFVINADQVRRHIAIHTLYRQRMSEDLKYEKRWPATTRRQMVESLGVRCAKQQKRVDDWMHTAAALVAGYCARQGVGHVLYHDAVQTYLPSYPWFKQRETLRHRLEQEGIEFTHVDGSASAAVVA